MAERNKYQERVQFPKGRQRRLLLNVQQRLRLRTDAVASLVNVHSRTMRDWQKEKFYMSYPALKVLCRHAHIPIPKNIQIRNPFWYTSTGSSAGGLAIIRKYGRVGGNPEYRKRKWQEWWEKEGRFKKHPIINVCKPFDKPKPSKELAEFFGIMMGDGGMTPSQFCITLHHIDDLEFTKYVVSLIKKLFKVSPNITTSIKDSINRIRVSRSGLVKYLNQLGVVIGNKIRQQFDIPDWIKKDELYLKACVRGLVDTDGCIIQHKYTVNGKQYFYKKIAFTTMSTPLRNSVFEAMQNWGFNPRVSQNRDIRLESINDVRRYFEIISSHNKKHLKKYYD